MANVRDFLSRTGDVMASEYDLSTGTVRDNLERCGYTAGTMWATMQLTDDWDAMMTRPQESHDMQTSVRKLMRTPTADLFHVVALGLWSRYGQNDHQLVIVFASNARAYSVQSNVGQFGPRFTSLGSSEVVIEELKYLIEFSKTDWNRSYVRIYERFARMCLEGSDQNVEHGVQRYLSLCSMSRLYPGNARLQTPQATIVVRPNQTQFWK